MPAASKIFTVYVHCLLVFAAILAAPSSHAEGGSESGGGGDDYAAHFSAVGKHLNQVYGMICAESSQESAVLCRFREKFSKAQKNAHVLPRESLLGQDGQPREAGPDGNGNIELNVPLYKTRIETPGATERVASLVAHEYMILAKAETEDSYAESSSLIDSLHSKFIDINALVGPPPGPYFGPPNKVFKCDDPTLEISAAPVGLKCRTSKGFLLERVDPDKKGNLGWKQPGGTVWFDAAESPLVVQEVARSSCASVFPQRLPFVSDLELAMAYGVNEVLRNFQGCFWLNDVRSAQPFNPYIAHPAPAIPAKGARYCINGSINGYPHEFDDTDNVNKYRCVSPLPLQVESEFSVVRVGR